MIYSSGMDRRFIRVKALFDLTSNHGVFKTSSLNSLELKYLMKLVTDN